MSHGHAVYENNAATWFRCSNASGRVVFVLAAGELDARGAMITAYGSVAECFEVHGRTAIVGSPFIITESAQATRRLT